MITWLVLVIFFGTIVLIISNLIPRSIAALVGAFLLITLGEYNHFFTQEQALQSIDFNTIGLLIGMMMIVAVVKKSGFLTYLAIKSAKLSGGNLFLLMTILGFVTAFVSMILDNVTTLVIFGPATILIADILGVSAIPFLITEVVFSNIGGVGTLIGDPPNIMIASDAGFKFKEFLIHMFPFVLVVLILLMLIVKVLFRKELMVKNDNFEAVLNMDERKAIKGKKGMKRSLGSLVFVLVLFIIEEHIPFGPAFIALFGASVALILVRPDPEEILKEVEWDVLFFFSALFILVEAAGTTGLFTIIAEHVTALGTTHFSMCATLLMLVAAVCSTFIGSIAFTAAAIPVIQSVPLAADQIETLWWSLSIGAGFGANGLPISSAAGVLCLSILKRSDRPLSMKKWLATASVLAIISILIATFSVFFLHRYIF